MLSKSNFENNFENNFEMNELFVFKTLLKTSYLTKTNLFMTCKMSYSQRTCQFAKCLSDSILQSFRKYFLTKAVKLLKKGVNKKQYGNFCKA